MKYIPFFLLIPLILLSGCMTPTSDDPRHRIIDISDRDGYSI